MNKIILIGLASLLWAGGLYANSAKAAWNELVDDKFAKRVAFDFVENDSELPNVLIYGDSISIAYTSQVRNVLEGQANVYRLHCNGGDSSTFIGKMTIMHEAMCSETLDAPWSFEWDVIHFNVGLHDLKYLADRKLDKEKGSQVSTIDEYKQNLEEIIVYLGELAPEAKLVFATTTPVPEGEPGRFAGDARKYNAAALDVLEGHPEIAVNDLFAFTLPNQPQWWTKPGNVHFNVAGKTAQGDEVATVILKQLSKK